MSDNLEHIPSHEAHTRQPPKLLEEQDYANNRSWYAQGVEKSIRPSLMTREPTIQSFFENHTYIIRATAPLHKDFK